VRKGFNGLWDKLTGAYNRTRTKNERETENCRLRDRREREALIAAQLNRRQKLQTNLQTTRQKHSNDLTDLLKGMSKHYQHIDKQSEIKKLYEQEKHHLDRSIKHDDGFEPGI
jgi:Mg2+ and Co2+ transporter CorA